MTGGLNLAPFVAGAYVLGVLVPAGFALAAWQRLRRAQRRLVALDIRARAGEQE